MKAFPSQKKTFARLNILTQGALAVFCLLANCPVSASLQDGATSLGGGWINSAWFGKLYDMGDGWLYSETWSWIYGIDGGNEKSWFYASDEKSWFWVDKESYPNVYRYADSKWLSFRTDSTDPRSYYDMANKTWFASDGSDGELWHDYYDAIVDAEVADYDEIYRNLIAVNTHNDALPWNEDHTKIRVTSWMSPKYISSYTVGSELTPTWEMWVTISGEAKTAAHSSGLSGDNLAMRMKQYLGLPPDGNYTNWVEFYVKPSDLYRPSADPDPRDCEAEPDFYSGSEMTISESYKEWYYNYEKSSYHLSRNGYPWTRLGYTYDWKEGSSEVGFSEFVIRPGSTINVIGVYTNAEYLESN